MYTEKEIGNIIKQLRGDMSLREFAEKFNVSHTTIDTLEKGYDFITKKPAQAKVATLQKIADACGVSLSYITGESSKDIRENELKVALFGGDTEVTDEMWNEVKTFADYIKIKYQKLMRETMTKITSRIKEIMHIRREQLKVENPKEKYGATYWSIRSKDKIKPGRIAAFIDARDIPNHEENILLSEILDVAPDWLSGESEKIPPVVLSYRVEHPEEYNKDIVYIASKSLTNERDSYIEKDDETFDVLYSAPLDKKNVK